MEIYIAPSAEGYVIPIAGIIARYTDVVILVSIVRRLTMQVQKNIKHFVKSVRDLIMINGRINMFILENFNVASFALGLLVGVGFEFIIWLFLLFIGGIDK